MVFSSRRPRASADASLRLEQALQIGEVLLEPVLQDLPGLAPGLRFHLGELAETVDRLLDALLRALRALAERILAGRVLERCLPFDQRFLQDLVAPLRERLDALVSLAIRLRQGFHVLALGLDDRGDIDPRKLQSTDELAQVVERRQ